MKRRKIKGLFKILKAGAKFMVYEFVGKIRNVDDKNFGEEDMSLYISEIHGKFKKPMDEVRILKDSKVNDILVKGQASVSSYVSYHDEELAVAIETFMSYLEEIEKKFGGEISKDEGFYNNSKTFHKLIW